MQTIMSRKNSVKPQNSKLNLTYQKSSKRSGSLLPKRHETQKCDRTLSNALKKNIKLIEFENMRILTRLIKLYFLV